MNNKQELWEYWFNNEWNKITTELKQYNHLDKIRLYPNPKEYKP